MTTEGDLARVLNALTTTLNDQKAGEFDAERVQAIATGATGGEQKLIAYGSGRSGELRDGSIEGQPVARIELDRGVWSVERMPEARRSDKLQLFEEQRSSTKQTEYQKSIRGRIAIWKKHVLP